ncbi:MULTISPECIES: hypothetical protein [Streptomyces]|uniref:Uncharacterized protein n=1 Tax=Streptomyces demainii TaxID=588122 RepID=A0ABT9KHJ9_9ACTN|nr:MULTISPECIES: hypothetical protein [Streptomyces]MCO8308791.1 hypothetical protein [Streptomyces sp. RKCA744]MDP9607874.1 hypothetical protein [Streptomyces demainii]
MIEGNDALQRPEGGPGAAHFVDQKGFALVTHDVANSVLASAIALRVFTPDAMALARRLLGAGVRLGAAALTESRDGTPAACTVHENGGPE